MVEQLHLRIDDVAHPQDGERRPPVSARLGVDRRRPGRAVATAQIVRAEDAELAGVEGLVGPDEAVPPTLVHFLGPAAVQPGHRGIDPGRVLAAGHGMEEQDHVRPVGVHPAVHLVGQGEPASGRPTRKTSGFSGSWYSKNRVWVLPMDWLMKPGGSSVAITWSSGKPKSTVQNRRFERQTAARRAWSRSARMSSMCSMPTLRRTSSGVMPPSRCCSSSSCE